MDVQRYQSKSRSRPFLALLFLLLLTVLLSTSASADMYVGRYDGNVTWSFDSNTGELRMYANCGTQTPAWAGLADQIRTVYIAPGVTQLPRDAFAGCLYLREIVLPDTVTAVGAYAFADCRSLSTLVLPERLSYVGAHAVTGCTALSYVTFRGSSQDWDALCLQMSTVAGNEWLISHAPVYTQRTYLVTVRYVSAETGEAIAPSAERTVTVGSDCTVLSPAVEHHTPSENAVVLKDVNANQSVTVVYYRTHCQIQVRYTDEAGNTILPDQHFTVAHGASLVLQAPEIEGYTLPRTAEVRLDAVTRDNTEHVFRYTRRTLSVTVRCLDQLGQPLCDPIVKDGIPYRGDYDIALPHFDGYTVGVERVSGSDLTQSVEQTVTYSPIYHAVTLRYVNEQGEVLAPSDVLTVRHGQSLTHAARAITGYTPRKSEPVELASVTASQSVDVVYEPARYLLTVRHETADGVLLALTSDYVTYGEPYECTPLPLTGYEAAEQQSAHLSGSMPAAPLTLTVYYQQQRAPSDGQMTTPPLPDEKPTPDTPPSDDAPTPDTPPSDGGAALSAHTLTYVAVALALVVLLVLSGVLIRQALKKRASSK